MTDFFVLRKRLAGTLTTPNVTEHVADVAASSGTMPLRPGAVVRATSGADGGEPYRVPRTDGLPSTPPGPASPRHERHSRPVRQIGWPLPVPRTLTWARFTTSDFEGEVGHKPARRTS